MVRPVIGPVLRDRLGIDGSSALADLCDDYGEVWKKDVMTECMDRFEVRLRTLVSRDEFVREMTELRLELREGMAQLRKEMGDLRAELLRWCFLFWIGQVAAMAGLIGVVLHFSR